LIFVDVSEIEAVFRGAGGEGDGFLKLLDGVCGVSGDGEGDGEVVEEGGVGGVDGDGLAILFEGFGFLVVAAEGGGEDVVGEGVVGIAGEGLAEGCDGVGDLAGFHGFEGDVEEAVELGGLGIDVLESALRDVDEFGDVDGAVGGGGVVDDYRRGVVAVGVDMGEHELGVGAAGLG